MQHKNNPQIRTKKGRTHFFETIYRRAEAGIMLPPLLIGKDTEMPDILVMLATFGGITIFGATGILIGPILVDLYMNTWNLYASTFNQITDEGC